MPDGVSVIDVLKHLITNQNELLLFMNNRINIQTEIHIDNKIVPAFIMRDEDNSIDVTISIDDHPYSLSKQDNFYTIEKYVTFSSSYDTEKISILIDDILEYDDTALVLKYGRFIIKNVDTN